MKQLPVTQETEKALFFHNYSRLPLAITHGEGCWLINEDGTRYLDMISGIGVNALGYGDKRLLQAITDQASRLIHASNLYLLKPQFDLASRLIAISGLSKVFFANSGTEAIEAAIKLSRKRAAMSGRNEKKEILSLTNCFHGRTYGAMSLTAKAKYTEGFDPLLPETGMIGFNDIADLEATISDKTAAVFIEPIQGEGGIHALSAAFIEKLTELRQKFDFLIVADEIQAGCGRTGKFFSYMHLGLKPDLVCLAKPLGGGLPLAAVIGNDMMADVFSYGNHGTTFGGNPVACAAGLAMIDAIYADGLMDNAINTGNAIQTALQQLASRHPQILDIRQFGLMIGITVDKEAKVYVDKALQKQVLVNATSQNVIRLLPPLTIGKEEVQRCITVLDEILTEESR
ncbi:MAG: aspartate aminotransferase family protein [Chlorobium sp.]|jgi:acetylornithine/N-succinyldiaminopimelate aminotransferase|uniref:aspartate aminotransferase family protein n=1 Tax=Chlorobium sp. TaxID=1095 RepID=UPI0025BAB642|nr:aspartate aminotransferase family protein [Chlorobium sp.]MCF8215259.1 aspartate aminotransferase family protein [Chlorobium sp.]MCF8270094.1 aspartate aminotransferase family protein [Chlorobium sp.]MCF8286465.1 aspartate aminotransferase family protein [Chlorobium sp.]MCF8290063.1 aspartate aminotransferase family protein [Chlorobium sp.]MCF8384134.1 aspartate aminotransferase family protein [Chlorobium sp.]